MTNRSTTFLLPVFLAACLAAGLAQSQPAGSSSSGPKPWYAPETEPDASGRLTFTAKPWWPRAKALKDGETLKATTGGDVPHPVEIRNMSGDLVEAIDETGAASSPWNEVSTIYLVSYGGSGNVDRMVAYYDLNHDGKADEMEIRYYENGELRFGLFGENYDRDGARIFDLKRWQYASDTGKSKFRGNLLFYYNKYNSQAHRWEPYSECPFAFWNANGTGHADTVLRAAIVPRNSLTDADLDYANNHALFWTPLTSPAEDMVIGSLRLSYDLDPASNSTDPHFTFGFTLLGNQDSSEIVTPYVNPLRPEPQTVYRMTREDALRTALGFHAQQTGLSWDEAGDIHRWEGQFWTYDRRPISNTGGPTFRWNVRREFAPGPSDSRQLYFSEIDQRYHLFGATESWIEIGHLVDDNRDLEIRMRDENHDGFFDTWEVFLRGDAVPIRTSRVFDPRATLVPLDRASLQKQYNETVLPRAIADDEALLASLRQFEVVSYPEKFLRAAHSAGSLEQKRFLLDIARELYFLHVRDKLYRWNHGRAYPTRAAWEIPNSQPVRFLHPLLSWLHHPWTYYQRWSAANDGYSIRQSVDFWTFENRIHQFEEDYGNGNLKAAAEDAASTRQMVVPTDHRFSPELLILSPFLVGITVAVWYLTIRRPARKRRR